MASVAYLSHPVGSPDEDVIQHGDNLENAGKWLSFLVQRTGWAILCPWLGYIVAGRPPGPRALVDQILLLERCDLMVQVGGRDSAHMRLERDHATRWGMPVVNLLDLGDRPTNDARTGREIRLRAMESNLMPEHRRVWMPPLTRADVEVLRRAQLKLAVDPSDDVALALVARIVAAATR